jgi:hypothetical protein
MFELKPISKEAIPRALEKAERYRLLSEPAEAESICADILRVEPNHQRALVVQLLALTDRFGRAYGISTTRPEDLLPRLDSHYERAYYAGVIAERRAKSQLQQHLPGQTWYDGFREAMEHYAKAITLQPPGNDDAILRWNTCARILMQNQPRGPVEPGEYVPDIE